MTDTKNLYEIQGYDERRGCYHIVEKRGCFELFLYAGYPKGNIMHCYPRRALARGEMRDKVVLEASQIRRRPR